MLSDEERAALEGWVRRHSTPQAWALRCRIILECAGGASNKDVAELLGATPHAVGRWRARFVAHRIAGLGDMPRPGGPRTVTDEQVAELIAATLERTPKDATHWSTRSMAAETGLSQSTVSRIWRAFGLAPHRTEAFKLSTDPYFVDKVHDVVGLYLDPPERALVFCRYQKLVLPRSIEPSQYHSRAYRNALRRLDIRQSTSRSGSCLDGAAAESFFATVKAEIGVSAWPDRATARRDIENWITHYNQRRLHSALGYKTPAETRTAWQQRMSIAA
ncbi:MAG TPA: IS630 family transposase [Actinocrinis sp.]|nr:IS630 family transposase [Actinocrinis sp.]HEV3172960.1 IS630 family transposase [Actinocrinis sp.]